MKILIVGAGGMLARDVIKELEGSCELYKRDIPEFDIRDEKKVFADITGICPDFVINCAAYTNVDGCETEEAMALAVNAEGVKHLAQACRETGSVLYHISTDFVFDGKKGTPYIETDTTNPLSVYGSSKLEGERFIQDILSEHVIIRTSWLFGTGGNNFVSTIMKLSEKKDEISVVSDQVGCPTYAPDLAKALKALIDLRAEGIYHFCNKGMCTWHEFACKIVELTGRKTRVVPITTQQFARSAERPGYSVMDCNKLISATGQIPRSWIEALSSYLTLLEEEK